MSELTLEILGWLGAVLILGGYALLASGKISKPGLLYHFMNLAGAVGIIANAAFHGSWPPVVLNVLWATIAILGIVSESFGRSQKSQRDDSARSEPDKIETSAPKRASRREHIWQR